VSAECVFRLSLKHLISKLATKVTTRTDMPAKKVAKKASKKVAKKAGKKHAGHHMSEDLRRAYEHLGRIDALEGGLSVAMAAQTGALTESARTALQQGDAGSAADLLRSCEHLAFGSLASTGKESRVGEDLQEAIDRKYEHLIERAAEHWDQHETEPAGALAQAYEGAFKAAEAAYEKGAFRRALEFARAADALSHVQAINLQLSAGGKSSRRSLQS
jgi:hypothetical protein